MARGNLADMVDIEEVGNADDARWTTEYGHPVLRPQVVSPFFSSRHGLPPHWFDVFGVSKGANVTPLLTPVHLCTFTRL